MNVKRLPRELLDRLPISQDPLIVRGCEKGRKIAAENNCAEAAIRAGINTGVIYEGTGEFRKANKNYEEAFELAKKVGEVYLMSWVGKLVGGRDFFRGETKKAMGFFEELLALDRRTKDTVNIAQDMIYLGWGHVFLGDWEEGIRYGVEGYEMAKKTGDYQTVGSAAYVLGLPYEEMGEYAEAEEYLQEGAATFERASDKITLLSMVYPRLAFVHVKKGEFDQAKALLERIREYGRQTDNGLVIAYAEALGASLLREQKDYDRSLQCFERTLQIYRSLELQEFDVWSYSDLLYEYGLGYLCRNGEGDKDKAFSLLDQALQIYQRVDAKKRIEKVLAKKKLMTA